MGDGITTVLLADDSNLYRDGLLSLFSRWDEFEVVGEAQNGMEAVCLCRKLSPDIVLMDVQMPIMDGVDATRLIMKEQPDTAIIMLTVSSSERYLLDAILAGARGYILKNIHSRQLKDLLRRVARGESVLSSEVTKYLMDAVRREEERELPEKVQKQLALLSNGEKDLLPLLALGYSNKEIGQKLLMSESSVKKKISTILVKLGIKNRVQAAVFALSAGLVDEESLP